MKSSFRFASRNAAAAHKAEEDCLDPPGCMVGTATVQILAQRIPADDAPATAMVQAFAALPKHLPRHNHLRFCLPRGSRI